MERSGNVDVSSMKLKQGVETQVLYECLAGERMSDQSVTPMSASANIVLDKPADLLVRLHETELVAVRPTATGWFAEFTLGAEEKQVVDEFSNSILSHSKKHHPDLAFISPLIDLPPHELCNGAAAKMQVKV